jgi:hypothetical protein
LIRAIPGTRHLCLEEGTHSNWLYEVLSPHVQEMVVAGVRQDRRPKSDKIDAFGLAEKLRIGAMEGRVYKENSRLNRNYNRVLKYIFTGAATTVMGRTKDGPLYLHYQMLLDGGTKSNLARLTIARQIASIVLSIWRSEEVYDPKKPSHST